MFVTRFYVWGVVCLADWMKHSGRSAFVAYYDVLESVLYWVVANGDV